MDFYTYGKRLDYLLELIRKGSVQSPKDLEERFDCTERTVRKMINDLRRRGYNIRYSRRQSRYLVDG